MRALFFLPMVFASWSAAAAPAEEPASFFASEVVTARKIMGAIPRSDEDPRFAEATATTVSLAAQRTVRLNDRDANAALVDRPVWAATVRALVTDSALALLVVWTDATEDRAPLGGATPGTSAESAVFGDSIALEMPLAFGRGLRLPHVGMGDDDMHVTVSMQRAVTLAARGGPTLGSAGRDTVGAGFGSLTRASFPGAHMSLRRDGNTWRALFVRPLDGRGQSLRAGLVPFALAAWDGGRHERGGNKALSSWKFLRLEGQPLDATYVKEMAYGYHPGDVGDAARGKMLAEAICTACHRLGDKRMAPEGLAPNLSGIGAVSTYGYLRDSIANPNTVLVQNLNINRHTVRTQGVDASGAFPNNEMYRWYTVDAAGNKMSKMTSFAAMPAADMAAIVAFLKTLGAAPPAAPAAVPAGGAP